MHEMQTIVTDVCGVSHSLSVSLFIHPSVGLSLVQHVQCVGGHLVQPLLNYFGLLFLVLVTMNMLRCMIMQFILILTF